jgi:type II secretory pathway pseudopilin PulG
MTLIEVAVVCAIIAMLIALTLPAIQSARAAARRLHCQHNLRQLAVAMQNYHVCHTSFPYGVNGGWGQSWSAHLLPFVERADLAAIIPWSDRGWWGGRDRNSRALQTLARTHMSLFRCPSQSGAATANVNQIEGRFITNYLACAGGNAKHDNHGKGGMSLSNGLLLATDFSLPNRSPRRQADVRRGTTHTVLLSEAVFLLDSAAGCYTCDRFYLYHPNADSRQGSDFSEALGSTYYPINTSRKSDVARECAFGSQHGAGIVVAWADGAVQFVSEQIDLSVWQAAGSIRFYFPP